MTRLLLASASPARLDTLRRAGLDPVVQVSEVDEEAAVATASARFGELDPSQMALVLARAKAEDVTENPAHEDVDLVLGCDSVLEMDGRAFGKPRDSAEAIARWGRMAGRQGLLHTGHWLVDVRPLAEGGTGATLGSTASTTVRFGMIDADEIAAYVATGEPLAVAGAFTVDGLGGPYIDSIDGDYHNVVGVSLPLLRQLVNELGVPWRALRG